MNIVVKPNETTIWHSCEKLKEEAASASEATSEASEASEEEEPENSETEKMNRSPSHRGIEAGERLYAKAKISESKKKEKIEEKEKAMKEEEDENV